MNRRTFLKTVPTFTVLAATGRSFAQAAGPTPKSDAVTPAESPAIGNLEVITLLPPELDGGKSVLAALHERKTTREIRAGKLPAQLLSNLLWAAWGVNRENGPQGRPGRTAASARNSQEIDLYVALPEGVYLYDAVPHRLVPVRAGDVRGRVARGGRGTAAQAPVNLILVADVARYARHDDPGMQETENQRGFYNAACGLIAGNVFLFAASQGLGAWFHVCDRAALAAELKLRPEQHVLYAQTVGYPA